MNEKAHCIKCRTLGKILKIDQGEWVSGKRLVQIRYVCPDCGIAWTVKDYYEAVHVRTKVHYTYPDQL